MKMSIGVLIVALCLIANGQKPRQLDMRLYSGTITGQVVDWYGNPVANALVIPMREQSGPVPSTFTDTEGKFILDHVKLNETYLVYVNNKEDGYLSTCVETFGCPSKGTCPKVTLDPENPKVNVSIRLGPKGGGVSGKVIDRTTGNPIAGATTLIYRRLKGGAVPSQEATTDRNGNFSLGPLPLCDLKLKVEASGYWAWFYDGAWSEETADDLMVESDTTKHVNVSLVPK